MKVEEIMTNDPAYATLNMSLHDVAKIMAEKDCGCLPVIETEADKTPIGMITDRDITIRTVAHNKNPLNMIAGEVMTNDVVSVTPDTTVEDCCRLMEKNQIRRVAVLDQIGALVGMVAQADIARLAPAERTAELLKDVSHVRRGATA
jgi:CBS domain-containing protein